MSDTTSPFRLAAWLQLLRLPNLFTLPGDVLAGYALATAGFARGVDATHLGAALGVSLLLYASGLLFNDWFDREEDARERPNRPLPAGAVRPGAVAGAAIGAMIAALALAPFAGPRTLGVALVLAALILFYDGCGKRFPRFGVLALGGCRALNLLLGAAAAGPLDPSRPWPLVAAALSFYYIVAVSVVAAKETERLPGGGALGLLAATPLLLLLGGLPGLQGDGCWGARVAWGVAAISIWGLTNSLRRLTDVHHVGRHVGWLLQALVFIQAFWAAAAGANCCVVAGMLALWLPARFSNRWFYGS